MWNDLIMLTGYMVRKPELKTLNASENARSVCNFSIGVNTGKKESSFFSCTAWGQTAEYIAKYAEKGTLISIEGIIEMSTYEKDDETRKSYNIWVKSCHIHPRQDKE